eukprot:scaffold19845_cov136-Cylindrotheca_fusiformis.AAC.1
MNDNAPDEANDGALVPYVAPPPHGGAIVPYDGRPTAAVQAIMNNSIAKKSQLRYDNENITLMMWLFDEDAEKHLRDTVLDEMNTAHALDVEMGTKGRKHLRVVCKKALENVNKTDKNCPIILETVTFNVFSHFLTTRKSKRGGMLATSSYGSVRSALVYLHAKAGYQTSSEFNDEMRVFNRGLKRKFVEERQASGESLEEGKKAMNFDVYCLMCKSLMERGSDDATFAHLFLVLEWNLMARSDNCANLKAKHIEWRHDCLVFFFGKTKGDQTGENSESPWHVYSNPARPSLCPVLALGKYLLSNPDMIQSNTLLFPGSNQYSRFIRVFHRVIEEKSAEFRALGVEKNTLGSHSCRKGAITLVTTGCTVSPPMASVCLRAGWSMGAVKERYIHYEKAGDQFTGRSVTGISSLVKEFAVSPVYWDFTEGGDEAEKAVMTLIEENIQVNSATVRPEMFIMLKYLFAAICYHHDFLTNHLAPTDKLRGARLFIEAADFEHKHAARIAYPWTATSYTPALTGIPPHTMTLMEFENVKSQLKEKRLLQA